MSFGGYLVAEAYATLKLDDRQFNAGLARATARWDAFGKRINSTFSTSAIAQMNAFSKALGQFGGRLPPIMNNVNGLARSIAALNRATGGMRGLGNLNRSFGPSYYQAVTAPFKAIGGILGRALSQVASLRGMIVGGGALFGATLSTKEFIQNTAEIEYSFAKIRRAAEFTDSEFQDFRKTLMSFGSSTSGVSLENLFDISEVGAKTGIAGAQLDLYVRDLAKVRIAIDEQDLPTKELAERIGSLITVFDRGNDEAIRFASALNALDLQSVASARHILDVSGRMSGTASLLGMKPQEVLALSTALMQAKVPIETAGTAMQQLMGRMASKKDSPQFARIAGMGEKQFLDVVGNDPLKAIIKVEEGLKRLDKITAIRALDQLGLDGQRVRGTLLQLGRVLPQLNSYVATANREWQSLDSIMKATALIGDTLQAKWQKVKNGFADTADALGKHLLPIFKAFADALEVLMYDIRQWLESNQSAIKAWAEDVAAKVRMIGVIWRNWGDVMELVRLKWDALWEGAGEIIAEFGKVVMANLLWLTGAMAKMLVNGLVAMIPLLLGVGVQLGIAIGQGIKEGIKGALTKSLVPGGGILADIKANAAGLQADAAAAKLGLPPGSVVPGGGAGGGGAGGGGAGGIGGVGASNDKLIAGAKAFDANKAFAPGALNAGVGHAPGFLGAFSNMGAAAGNLVGGMGKQSAENKAAQQTVWDRITGAIKQQGAQKTGRDDDQAAKDAETRRQAEMARKAWKEQTTLPSRRMRKPDISLLRGAAFQRGGRFEPPEMIKKQFYPEAHREAQRQEILRQNMLREKLTGTTIHGNIAGKVAVPKGFENWTPMGPGRAEARKLGNVVGRKEALQRHRERLAMPLALRDTEYDPRDQTPGGQMGPPRAAAGLGMPQGRIDAINREIQSRGRGHKGSPFGRLWKQQTEAARQANKQRRIEGNRAYKAWRKQVNDEFTGKSLEQAGGGRAAGVTVSEGGRTDQEKVVDAVKEGNTIAQEQKQVLDTISRNMMLA
jgi:TP901 family phage tail tape measure protein